MKLLVVEDEIKVCKVLVMNLAKLGYNNCKEASNGLEAVKIIEEWQPDIILSDIRMPGMDGIELLEQLHQMKNKSIFIILSGYDSFSYAQKAVRMGAFAYLLKPIPKDELAKTIHEAEQECKKRRLRDESMMEMRSAFYYGKRMRQREAVEALIFNDMLGVESRHLLIEKCNLDKAEVNYYVMMLHIEQTGRLFKINTPADQELLCFLLHNIAMEYFIAYDAEVRDFLIGQEIGLLIDIPDQKSNEYFISLSRGFIEMVEKMYDCSVSAGISQPGTLEKLPVLCREAQAAMGYRLVQELAGIFSFDGELPEDAYILPQGAQVRLFSSLEQQDCLQACNVIRDLLSDAAVSGYMAAKMRQGVHQQLLTMINKTLEMRTGKIPPLIINITVECQKLSGMFRLTEIMDRYQFWLQQGIERGDSQDTEHEFIIEVQQYVCTNYQKYDTGLESISDSFGVSTAHFSRKFKSVFNQTFIQYLTDYRMQQAARLLKENRKTADVAKAVGYLEVKYFSKIFKREMQVTPAQFKAFHSKEH